MFVLHVLKSKEQTPSVVRSRTGLSSMKLYLENLRMSYMSVYTLDYHAHQVEHGCVARVGYIAVRGPLQKHHTLVV